MNLLANCMLFSCYMRLLPLSKLKNINKLLHHFKLTLIEFFFWFSGFDLRIKTIALDGMKIKLHIWLVEIRWLYKSYAHNWINYPVKIILIKIVSLFVTVPAVYLQGCLAYKRCSASCLNCRYLKKDGKEGREGGRLNSELSVSVFVPWEHTHFFKL